MTKQEQELRDLLEDITAGRVTEHAAAKGATIFRLCPENGAVQDVDRELNRLIGDGLAVGGWRPQHVSDFHYVSLTEAGAERLDQMHRQLDTL